MFASKKNLRRTCRYRVSLGIDEKQRFGNVLQMVVDDVEAFRAKVNDAVAVTDGLHDHKQTWLEQMSCLKAQTARSDTADNLYFMR